MIPAFETAAVTLYLADVRAILAQLPADSIDCVVTSPPYWGLRAYGTPPQIWAGEMALCTDELRPHEHEWHEQLRRIDVGSQGETSTLQTNGTKYDTVGHEITTGFCVRCEAWRGEYGLEPTPELYVAHTVEIFREIRRVLRARGTLFLNLGDSYTSGGRDYVDEGSRLNANGRHRGMTTRGARSPMPAGLKQKDLVGIPWRVAFALQADGWYLRSDIIWAKPNPMPESVTDRPTKSHEYVFLLTKSADYYWDQEAVREPLESSPSDLRKMIEKRDRIGGKTLEDGEPLHAANAGTHIGQKRGVGNADAAREALARSGNKDRKTGDSGRTNDHIGSSVPWTETPGMGRNVRSVWTIATQAYEGAHYATFPEELPRRCILAGTPEQICVTCGKARERIVGRPCPKCETLIERQAKECPACGYRNTEWRDQRASNEQMRAGESDTVGPLVARRAPVATNTADGGFTDCGHDAYGPGVVLDPFAGSGTTLAVAAELGRRGIGIDLDPRNVAMVERRVAEAELNRSRSTGGLDSPIVAVPVSDLGPLWAQGEVTRG